MLEDLEQAGLLADTLVVVTSDHGEGFGEHGEQGHGLLTYQESLAVPLVLRGPGIPAGREIAARVGLVDLMPSLLAALDVARPPASPATASCRGSPKRRGAADAADPQATFYFESLLGKEDRNWAPITGLLRGEDKLIAVPKPELYDLAADPGEKNNHLENERRRWRELDEQLRGLLLGKDGEAAGRAADEQDLAALRSLGYVSSGGAGGAVLDPKDGIALDQRLAGVEKALAEGDVEAARRQLDAARAALPGVEQPAFYLLEKQLREAGGDEAGALAALRRGVARMPEVFPLRFELLRWLYEHHQHAEVIAEGQKMLDEPARLGAGAHPGRQKPGPRAATSTARAPISKRPRRPTRATPRSKPRSPGSWCARAGCPKRSPSTTAWPTPAPTKAKENACSKRPCSTPRPATARGPSSCSTAASRSSRTASSCSPRPCCSPAPAGSDEAADRMRQALEHAGDLNADQQNFARQALRSWGKG